MCDLAYMAQRAFMLSRFKHACRVIPRPELKTHSAWLSIPSHQKTFTPFLRKQDQCTSFLTPRCFAGGYEDDRDEGEWFLYTGSGGRDLSGNKRTNKEQSFDQKFESSNKALRTSCERGLPVRVVRSYKERRSAYAPTDSEWGLRYDGVYKIIACWRITGQQGTHC
jgi:hypothetical protein